MRLQKEFQWNRHRRRIHSQLPLKELAAEYTNLSHKSKRGNKPLFSGEGEIALMFLKSYTGLSDDGLIEMFNGSIHMQMFCGVLLAPSCPIKDGKIGKCHTQSSWSHS